MNTRDLLRYFYESIKCVIRELIVLCVRYQRPP